MALVYICNIPKLQLEHTKGWLEHTKYTTSTKLMETKMHFEKIVMAPCYNNGICVNLGWFGLINAQWGFSISRLKQGYITEELFFLCFHYTIIDASPCLNPRLLCVSPHTNTGNGGDLSPHDYHGNVKVHFIFRTEINWNKDSSLRLQIWGCMICLVLC